MSHYDDMMRRVMDDATRRPPDPAGWIRIADLENKLARIADLARGYEAEPNSAYGGGGAADLAADVLAIIRKRDR